MKRPETITFDNGRTIITEYDAEGTKLKKIDSNGETTDYEEDEIYEDGVLYQTSHDEGRIVNGEFEYNITDHLGNTRISFKDNEGVPQVTQVNHIGAWGEPLESLNSINTTKVNNFTLSTYEKENDFGINIFDAHARVYDAITPRMWQQDVMSEKWSSYSSYNYTLGNPLRYIDPDGRDITITSQIIDGKLNFSINVTGKIVNDSKSQYTSEQLQEYADRLSTSIASVFTGSEGDVSWNANINITVASKNNKLKATDHAFRITDQDKINEISETVDGVTHGYAPYGENVMYLSDLLTPPTANNKPATEGEYVGTGKNEYGDRTLERTGPHELGHSANLMHPEPQNTMNGNLMHQTKLPNAGLKVTAEQIIEMHTGYINGKLNHGKQKK